MRTFKPKISEDGVILAGGMRIGEVRDTEWVFDDPCFTRQNARGTEDVPVSLHDLVQALLDYYGRDE
jgi:hypothetical protein